MSLSAVILIVATTSLGLVQAPTPTRPGELPRPTKDGIDAMIALIDRAVAGGGLRSIPAAGGDTPHYEVVNVTKLALAVDAARAQLSPALVDAIVGGWRVYDEPEERLAVALLKAIGDRGDDRAGGFASFFSGQLANRARKTGEAVRNLDQAIRLFGRAGDSGWEATAHHEAGITLRAAGDFGSALTHHRAALAIREKLLGRDDPLTASTLNNLGVVHEAAGEFDRAEEYHRRALSIRTKVLPADDPALASTYRNLSLALFHSGQLEEAARYSELALVIRRGHSQDDPANLADALGSLGVVRSERNELEVAEALLLESLEILRKLGPNAELGIAEASSNLGVVAKRAGDNSRALTLFSGSLSIHRRRFPPGHPQIAHDLNEMSMTHADMGEVDKALAEQRESLRIYRDRFGPNHPQVARSLNNLGGLYQAQGDDPRALAHYQEALATWRKVHPRPHPDVAYCLDNIAGVYRRKQALSEALPLYKEALAILEKTLGPRHPEVIQNLGGLASVAEAAGLGAEAAEHARRALELARAAFPNGHPGLVATLNNAGMSRARSGDLAGAERDLLEARDLARRVDPAHEALALENLAHLQIQAGNLETADRTLGESLETARRFARLGPGDLDPATPLAGRVLARRAEVRLSRLGAAPNVADLRACVGLYEASTDVLERLRGDVIGSAPGKLEAGEKAQELFPKLIGLRRRLFAAEGRPEDLHAAYTAAERVSARVFLESLGRARAGRIGGVAPELLDNRVSLVARVRTLDGRIEAEQARPLEQRKGAEIDRLQQERDQAEAELDALIAKIGTDYPRYAALTSPRPCSLAEARLALAEDEVALLFVPGEEGSELILLEGGDLPKTLGLSIHPLAPVTEIMERVQAILQPKVLDDRDAARERGAELFKMLLGPVAASIRGKALVVVAGGPLGSLPFELLVEPAPGDGEGHWLVENHRIRHAPSMTSLHLIRQWEPTRAIPPRPFWALGDPIYRPDDPRWMGEGPPPGEAVAVAERSRGATATESFTRLPASGDEVVRLRVVMGAEANESLLGSRAREADVKRLSREGILNRYHHVHFACHGVLGLGGVRPGLVLTLVGDQDGEDGILGLDEVTGLTLNADLVVLSACQTGQGATYKAEGVSGLARAFLYAGSRGVLCSLWRVDDAATADLMVDLYGGLKAGKPVAEALQTAQIRMIQAGETPLRWAPFVLIGL